MNAWMNDVDDSYPESAKWHVGATAGASSSPQSAAIEKCRPERPRKLCHQFDWGILFTPHLRAASCMQMFRKSRLASTRHFDAAHKFSQNMDAIVNALGEFTAA